MGERSSSSLSTIASSGRAFSPKNERPRRFSRCARRDARPKPEQQLSEHDKSDKFDWKKPAPLNAALKQQPNEGRILGFSAADTRNGTIWALFIDPDHEGRSIGRALLARACDVLREAGHRAATLGTEPGSRADCFYREAGWTALHIDKRGEQVFRLAL